MTDGARLRQALINLTGNAVKFTTRGSVRIVVTFLAQWREGRPAIRIDVIDTGIGIREEVLPQLFRPFAQGDPAISREFGGTGLGLALSRHIAGLLGGELTVLSVWGQGSTFTLTIPTGDLRKISMLRNPAEAVHLSGGVLPKSGSVDLRGIRVLLAEDGFDNRELIRTVLSKAGAQVEAVENGRLAVARAEAVSFDVILMDINMPEMDGYEATRTLRDRHYDRPILALTANAMSGDSDRCLAAGCNAYLTKPIDRAQLIQAIAAHVGRKPPDDETPLAASGAEETHSQDEAVRSEFADDPEMTIILEGFLQRLTGHVDDMSKAIAAGRCEDLQRMAHNLKGASGSYGYPSLTDAAKGLEDAAKGRDLAASGLALDGVTALCRAIQRGHVPSLSEGVAP